MIQYLEVFLFIFIPFLAWGLVSYNLLIRDKIALDTSNNVLRTAIQEKLKLTPKFYKFIEQQLPSNYETNNHLKELSDTVDITADILKLLKNMTRIEEILNISVKQIEQNENKAKQQQFIDIKHYLLDIDIRIKRNLMQYDRAAKYLNARLDTFPANLFAKFFRIKPGIRIPDTV